MKYLLVIAIALGVYWMWRQERLGEKAGREKPAARRPAPASALQSPQAMVSCAVCGLHLPRSEALADGPGGTAPFYYCPEHRQGSRR